LFCLSRARKEKVPEKRYVVGGRDGWLNVKREPSSTTISIPEFLQVEVSDSKNGRDHFTALEGVERGKKFSVKTGNLKSGSPVYHSAAHLQFSLSKELLTYQGGQVKAITHPLQPPPLSSHPVQIPDFAHDKGIAYLGQTPYAKNWFYLGQGNAIPGNNDRYLHTGLSSAGCITVEPTGWTRLYQYLILCRRGDGKTVGMVTVVR
jgi:hypothetical protein